MKWVSELITQLSQFHARLVFTTAFGNTSLWMTGYLVLDINEWNHPHQKYPPYILSKINPPTVNVGLNYVQFFLLGVCACVFKLQCNYQINKHHLMIQCHETEYWSVCFDTFFVCVSRSKQAENCDCISAKVCRELIKLKKLFIYLISTFWFL